MSKKIKNYKVYLQNRQGFSLIESVIGIFIISTVFVTFLTLLPKTFQTESRALRLITATNLAQEGIEMVRNLRDNNLKITGCAAFDTSSPCIFKDNDTNIILSIPVGLFESNATKVDPPFERTIEIADDPADIDNRKIISTVKYNSDTMALIETILYPWGENEN